MLPSEINADYLGGQFIVGLKIWHGSEYDERGEKQLTEYLEYFHKELKVPLDQGYLIVAARVNCLQYLLYHPVYAKIAVF